MQGDSPVDEDSGLHDIRNLASSQRVRLSAKRISQPQLGDEDVLAASSGAWKAVALPEPSKAPLSDLEPVVAKAEPVVAEPGKPVDPFVIPIGARASTPPAKKAPARSGRTIYAIAGAAVAAAAGAAIFITTQNKSQDRASEGVTAPAATDDRFKGADPTITAPAGLPNDGVSAGSAAPTAGSGSATPEVDAGIVETTPPPPDKHVKDSDAVPVKKPTKRPPDEGGKKRLIKGKTVEEPEVKGKPAPLPEPTTKKPPVKDAEPSIEDLLKEAGDSDDDIKKDAKPKLEKTQLSGDDFKKGMASVAKRAQACYAGTQGMASLKIVVAPSGKISKVTVSGPFAGQKEGACVEAAVRSASFPPWDGPPQSFGFSYLLSE